MNAKANIYCLALHPVSGHLDRPDPADIPAHLQGLGLLGESFLFDGETRFKLGERFYQLLSFMGCAPALKLEQDDPGDSRFCHFRFIELAQPDLRFLRSEVKARCPYCRKPGDTAGHILGLFGDQDWHCPHCGQAMPLQAVNWKHEAGMSQYFIELLDVHPHEVVPTDGLLKELEVLSGQKWDYFYTVANV